MDLGAFSVSLAVKKILDKQDDRSRWGYDEKRARERPEYLYYSPTFKATLWTLVLLADLQAPPDLPHAHDALRLITDHFYSPQDGIFCLPNRYYFPIPCLNGNLLYLHHYFGTGQVELLDKVIHFFSTWQRFDDGGFKTPGEYPYCSNRACYGRHTCYWGVAKLLKGISFLPEALRSRSAQRLLELCIDFVLQHEVCFSSHQGDNLLQRDIGKLVFPNFYHSDLLEILWLLMREGVRDRQTARALDLLLSKRQADGSWQLEKSMNTIVSVGQKGCANPYITVRASEVLEYYG